MSILKVIRPRAVSKQLLGSEPRALSQRYQRLNHHEHRYDNPEGQDDGPSLWRIE